MSVSKHGLIRPPYDLSLNHNVSCYFFSLILVSCFLLQTDYTHLDLKKKKLFIWLLWVFVALLRFSLVAASGAPL